MPAGSTAYYWERQIRLKPGLQSGDAWIKHSTFIRRLNAYRDRDIQPGTSDPADEFLKNTPDMPSWNPGFSRLNAYRDRDIQPGKPDPAEAGTPEWRYLDEKFNVHSPVGCLPGVAYCRASLIRLKPGLQSGDTWMKNSTFIRRLGAC
jgi:hypothetical protein